MRNRSRHVAAAAVTLLLAGVTGCGTLLYPERRGQTRGRIDAGVAVMDGIGLLFFIIPGMIAYAIDFSTGAIYLPGGSRTDIHGGIRVVHLPREELNEAMIDAVIARETGMTGAMQKAQVSKVDTAAEIPALFARAEASGFRIE